MQINDDLIQIACDDSVTNDCDNNQVERTLWIGN